MKARTMNSTVAAAVALTLMATTAPKTNAEPRNDLSKVIGQTVAMRTLLHYADGAWVAPTSIILKSEHDWQEWNDSMVADGKAVGAEACPSGVDWTKEAVLVVALGQGGGWVDLPRARHIALHTDVDLVVGPGSWDSSPCQVVAMDRKMLTNCRLMNGSSAQPVPVYVSPSAQVRMAGAGAGAAEAINASWGAVKAEYR
jgi:hypothetical protein